MTWVFLLLVFLAELAAVAAIGYASFILVGGGFPAAVVALVLMMVVFAVWAMWAAPRADATSTQRVVTKALVFTAAVVGLVIADRPWWALALALLIIVAVGGAAAKGHPPGAGQADHQASTAR